MRHSHRYFRNTACQYFPCHPGADRESFNCLFCFCPLYFLENCGGDHETRQGVKDCTPCLRPHRPEGYDAILARLREEAAKRRSAPACPGETLEKTPER